MENIADQVPDVDINHPYIGTIIANESISFTLVTERLIVFTSNSFYRVLRGLMAAYYVFNIEYPKNLYHLMCFIQHFLFGIKIDTVPPAIVKFISCFDKL